MRDCGDTVTDCGDTVTDSGILSKERVMIPSFLWNNSIAICPHSLT